MRVDAASAICTAAIAFALASPVDATTLGLPGGPEPEGIGQVATHLHADPYDMELLISFGTSKGGSAGHLALALRGEGEDDDIVYSANFYADRSSEHAQGFYTKDLMLAIPKQEYLYGTRSSLGENASFGLDYGEAYKRSVIGVRVYGVPETEKAALVAFMRRINEDYHAYRRATEYHDAEVKYDYLQFNCAKSIGSAFKYGAGYGDLEIARSRLSPRRKLASALNANIPTEMAMKLIDQWNARGYRMDVVLYRKYAGSTYVDPHDENGTAFKDLPDRFPSVLSRDYLREQGEYRDFDNLYAMYVLYNMGRYAVRVDDTRGSLVLETLKTPMPYAQASERAIADASVDSRRFRTRLPFVPAGKTLAGNSAAPREPAEPASP